ncbi:MAG: fibronectin type III domain-containing protein [Ruminococcaceae bacterium]|nr:fibronectin type III domain-containing protein [Oscillospiraceae bacterium]
MKKTLSIILSIVMLISSMLSAVNAFAYKKAEAPTVTLGESFEVNMKAVSALKILALDEDDLAKSDFYCAKFTPEKTAYYEFVFDTDYTDADDDSMLIAFIGDEKDEIVNMSMCLAFDEEDMKELEELGITDNTANPSMASQLTKGKAYYLIIVNVGKKAYKSNVVINEHTHKTYNDKEKAYVDDEDLEFCFDGSYYTTCDENGCDYMKTTKTIYAVKSISLSKSSYTYDGKEKKPTVTIKDRKGNKLDKSNYSVKYSSNKKVGTAKVKITFKNDYEGSFTKTFKINPKGTSLTSVKATKKGFTAKWKKQSTQTTGYQIQYATDSKFTKSKKTVTVKGTKNLSKTVSKLGGKKKYYVRVRTYKTVGDKKYYSSWSKAKTVTTKK